LENFMVRPFFALRLFGAAREQNSASPFQSQYAVMFSGALSETQMRDLGRRCRNATVVCTVIVLTALSLGSVRESCAFVGCRVPAGTAREKQQKAAAGFYACRHR
jgi:hypothetical protein